MFETKLTEIELLRFIRRFYRLFVLVPSTRFLAQYFKVNILTIERKLASLELDNKIKRIKKNKYYIDYKLK